MTVQQVTGPIAHHAEGPVWSDSWGGLRWVDMMAGDMLSLHAHGSVERRNVEPGVRGMPVREFAG